MADAGSVVGVFSWGTTPVWSRGGTGKGRFGEAGDKACESLDPALRLALGVDQLRYRLFLLICCLPALGFVHAPSGTAENDPSFSFIASCTPAVGVGRSTMFLGVDEVIYVGMEEVLERTGGSSHRYDGQNLAFRCHQ